MGRIDRRAPERSLQVLGLDAAHARALREAGIGECFAAVWRDIGGESSSALAAALFDPVSAEPAAGPRETPLLPFDVVDATSDWLAGQDLGRVPRVLDLSVGAGQLAAKVVSRLLSVKPNAADELLSGMTLIEPDHTRLEVAGVIVARALEPWSADAPSEVLRRVRAASIAADAASWAESRDGTYDLVWGATPRGPSDEERSRLGDSAEDPSARFMQVLCDTVDDGGAAALIALGSAVTAPVGEAARARDRLLERFKTAEFLTYSHEPNPLLWARDGESRAILRVRALGIGQVTTTPIMRCDAANRRARLNDPPRTLLHQTPPFGRHSFVPRIGTTLNAALWMR